MGGFPFIDESQSSINLDFNIRISHVTKRWPARGDQHEIWTNLHNRKCGTTYQIRAQ